jgi:hypothetical protein
LLLDDLQEIVAGPGVQRLQAPVVEDQQLDAAQGARQARIAAVGDGEIGEELGRALVED